MMKAGRVLLSALPLIAWAQGFPWELSPRLPVKAPTHFLGISGQLLTVPSVATLQAVEHEWSCATYRRGTGLSLSVGIHGEWWCAPEGALRGLLAMEYATLQLTAPGEPLPLRNGDFLQTEFQFRSAFWLLRGELSWKRRLWRWIWGSIAGWIAVQWQLRQEQWEVVLRPDDYFFNTFPPSRQRRLDQARSIQVRPYGAGIRCRFGYDLPLARHSPLYAAPALVVGTSLVSLAHTATWQRWEIGAEIALLFGLGTGRH